MNLNVIKKALFVFIFLLISGLLNAQKVTQNALHDTIPVVSSQLKDSVPNKQSKKSFLEDIIKYPAKDSVLFDILTNTTEMFGQAVIEYQNIKIESDYIAINLDKKELFARGIPDSTGEVKNLPVFTQDEQSYKAKSFRYNFDSKKAIITGLITEQNLKSETGFLHSETTKRDADGNLNIKDGKFTVCNAEHPHYYVALTKARYADGKNIVSGPAYLVVEDIPIYFLGLPFGFFPMNQKQSSGLIIPSYGEEQNRGFFLRDGGWFFAINDHFNFKVTGDIYSKGSWKTNFETNYKNRYKYSGRLGFSMANNRLGEPGTADFNVQKDYKVMWSHNQDPKAHPYRTFSANVNFSTSSFDRYNSYDQQDYLTNTKTSSIAYSRKFSNPLFRFSAKLGHSQNSKTQTVTMNLPTGSFSVASFNPFKRKKPVGKQRWYEKIKISYSSRFDNRLDNIHEDSLLTADVLNNFRNGFEHKIPVNANFKLFRDFNVTPKLDYQGNVFFYTTEKSWDAINDSLIETRTNEVRYAHTLQPFLNMSYNPTMFMFYNYRKGRVKVLRHMIKPSISMSLKPNLGENEDKYYRYVQTDSLGNELRYSIFEDGVYKPLTVVRESGMISFGIDNNFEMKVANPADSTGKLEKIKLIDRLSFRSSYDMYKDSMNLAPITMSGNTRLFNKVSINFGAQFNPYAIDETGRVLKEFAISENGKLLRMTRADISLQFSLPFEKKSKGSKQDANAMNEYDYFDMPWGMNISYNFNYSKPGVADPVLTQSIRVSGNLKLTDMWDIRYSSGFDFVRKEFTPTRINISRSLHCWQMAFEWVPFGFQKRYMFTIRANSSMLEALKYEKKKSNYDYNSVF